VAKSAIKPARPHSNVAWRLYSTITNSTTITEWHQPADPKQLPVSGRRFVIKGGAGIAQKRGLITMLGVMTEATQDEMDFLNAQSSFKKLVETGWVVVHKAGGWRDDPDAVAADMMQRDGSAPLVANDYVTSKDRGDMSKTVVPLVGGRPGYSPTNMPRSKPLSRIVNNFA
jgi:hypothetical protein